MAQLIRNVVNRATMDAPKSLSPSSAASSETWLRPAPLPNLLQSSFLRGHVGSRCPTSWQQSRFRKNTLFVVAVVVVVRLVVPLPRVDDVRADGLVRAREGNVVGDIRHQFSQLSNRTDFILKRVANSSGRVVGGTALCRARKEDSPSCHVADGSPPPIASWLTALDVLTYSGLDEARGVPSRIK